MIQFDPQTLSDWQTHDVHEVTLEFVSAGCDGTELRLREGKIGEALAEIVIARTSVRGYIDPTKSAAIDGAYITQVKGKWIIKSEAILTRCGCGKSFSLRSGNMRDDKIKLLRSKLSKKPKHTL